MRKYLPILQGKTLKLSLIMTHNPEFLDEKYDYPELNMIDSEVIQSGGQLVASPNHFRKYQFAGTWMEDASINVNALIGFIKKIKRMKNFHDIFSIFRSYVEINIYYLRNESVSVMWCLEKGDVNHLAKLGLPIHFNLLPKPAYKKDELLRCLTKAEKLKFGNAYSESYRSIWTSVDMRGVDLVPEMITDDLGIIPTDSVHIGDDIKTAKGGKYETGVWIYELPERKYCDFDQDSLAILSGFENKRDIIVKMNEQFDGRIHFGILYASRQSTQLPIKLSSPVLKYIAEFNLSITFDAYHAAGCI